LKQFNIQDYDEAEQFYIEVSEFFNLPVSHIYRDEFERIRRSFGKGRD